MVLLIRFFRCTDFFSKEELNSLANQENYGEEGCISLSFSDLWHSLQLIFKLMNQNLEARFSTVSISFSTFLHFHVP